MRKFEARLLTLDSPTQRFLTLEKKAVINMIFAAAPSQSDFLKVLRNDASIDWSRINAFHMDEYIGLDKDAPQGFGNLLKREIFGLVPFKTVNYINGSAADPEKECERYATLLNENPVDIVCLGIGENGHIAFNDPPVADFNDPKLVKVVDLEQICRQQQVNDNCFTAIELVPEKAKAGYATGYADPEYIGELPVFTLPFLSEKKKYRTFQLKGDSMLPIPDGSWVTGEYLQDWMGIISGKAYVVFTLDDGIVFKVVENNI